MDREAELEIVRRAYAKRLMFVAGVHDRRVEAAFASVPRELFLGRGPWPILRWDRGYVPTPSRNPVYIYDDVLIGIVPERHLNNGQPSLHALLITSAGARPGEHTVHHLAMSLFRPAARHGPAGARLLGFGLPIIPISGVTPWAQFPLRGRGSVRIATYNVNGINGPRQSA